MKTLIFALFVVLQSLEAKPAQALGSQQVWWQLSVRCQNIAQVLMGHPPSSAVEPSQFADDLEFINSRLDELVDDKQLLEKQFTLPSPENLKHEQFAAVHSFVESLSSQYGYFVARELVDMGLRRRLSSPQKPTELTVRLPERQMKLWTNLIKGQFKVEEDNKAQDTE